MSVLSLFFCFKQKTAYEMRISDWSSDVCSSDLPYVDGDGDPVEDRAVVRVGGIDAPLRREDEAVERLVIGRIVGAGRAAHDLHAVVVAPQQARLIEIEGLQIGRAHV